MTGVVLVSIYLIVLASFLGLDLVTKVPPTLYGVVLAAVGVLAGTSLVSVVYVAWDGWTGAAVGMAAFGSAGGLVALGQLLRAFNRKSSGKGAESSAAKGAV
jgi:NAD(P) transhydrogenase subunit alpha